MSSQCEKELLLNFLYSNINWVKKIEQGRERKKKILVLIIWCSLLLLVDADMFCWYCLFNCLTDWLVALQQQEVGDVLPVFFGVPVVYMYPDYDADAALLLLQERCGEWLFVHVFSACKPVLCKCYVETRECMNR